MLKKSGKRRAEGDMYRSIADKGVFWKGFFEQFGRILGASRLQVGEARFERGGLTVAEFCRREGVSDPSF